MHHQHRVNQDSKKKVHQDAPYRLEDSQSLHLLAQEIGQFVSRTGYAEDFPLVADIRY